MMPKCTLLVLLMAGLFAQSDVVAANHRFLIQGRGKLAIVDERGQTEWQMPWGAIHDIHVLKNGHMLVQQGAAKVAEIDPASKAVVWSYDSATQNGNAGKRVEVHAFQPLDDGRLMIAESGIARIIEVDRQGMLLKEVKLKVLHPNAHADTRLARKLATGNYLVCHEGDGTVREYDGDSGDVVWEYEVPLFGREPAGGHGPEAFGNKCFAAVRLANGNTLISTGNGHSVLEVAPEKKIVWQIGQRDLPGITLAWVTTLEMLPNGHYVIGNCHAGPDNPQLFELDPKTKKVVWTFRDFATFGNDVSNTIILDGAASDRPPARASAENWPQFRGPTGQGLSDEKGLPIVWGGEAKEHLLWQSPLIGEGHASPIVWGDRIFVATARWPADVADKVQVVPEHHLLCYDAADGRLVGDTKIPPGPWKRNDFRSGAGGGYAAPTPATDGRHVFCAYGSSVLAAVDFGGQLVWRNEILPHTFDVTLGSSPVLFGETVILLHAMSNKADSRVVAYRKSDGAIDWQQPLKTTGFGHSTPLVIQEADRPQMLILASGMSAAPDALLSVDPTNGRKLWWCRGAGDAASPAYGAGIVYFDNGRGGPGTAVAPTGEGDVSPNHVRWTIDQVPEGISSPIIVDDLVYRLSSPGVLRCWQAADGKQVYAQRLDGISSTWASPIADGDGHIFFATAGKSFVIQKGRDYKCLATNDLGDPNHCSPAASAGKLFLVGTKNIYCIGKAKEN